MSEKQKIDDFKEKLKRFCKNSGLNLQHSNNVNELIPSTSLDIALMVAEIPESEYQFFQKALDELLNEGWRWNK